METNDKNPFSDYIQNLKDSHYQNLNSGQTVIQRFPIFDPSLTLINLWHIFLNEYEKLNHMKFIDSDESKKFVFTLIYYFLRHAKFYDSPSIYHVEKCKISLNKGLFVVGGVGVGKTSIMKTIVLMIEKYSVNFNLYPVRIHNTLDIVDEFESSIANCKNDIIIRYSKGFRVFDDVKNEREASNYGKVDLFKEIFYKRFENKNFRTIILSNYDFDFPNSMPKAIDSFERYGDRNYDRLFEAFNFIEFKGVSNRR